MPMLGAYDLCRLHGTLFKGSTGQITKPAKRETEEVGLAYWWKFLRVFNFSLKPAHHCFPRRSVRLIFVMRSNMPNPKLAIATVEVGAAVDGKASITCSQRQSEHQRAREARFAQ